MGIKHRHAAKKETSLVKRSPKVASEAVASQLAGLLESRNGDAPILKKYKPAPVVSDSQRLAQRHAIQIVGNNKVERVLPVSRPSTDEYTDPDVSKDNGLKLLRREVKNQSHLRQLPQHQRHDYEYQLRRVATAGVVRLFNALSSAQRAGQQHLETAQESVTIDKAEEKKSVTSRDTFLRALRSTQPTSVHNSV